MQIVGRMVLNRNPDNFFAETEQVAFCTAHIVPGLDFTNDPLLAGRIHSYVDTQISRLGGPNFHELPINAPIAQVHNNQRDGMHRQAIHRGRVAYEPNSLAGGCPFQAGAAQGFTSVARRLDAKESADKVRIKPEKFADHYTQARLFFESQSEVEKAHIGNAFRFELSKVTVPAIRERVVASLLNASPELAARLAQDLGMDLPAPMPKALENPATPEVESSPALSLMARPGDGGIRTRKIAVLVANGVEGTSLGKLVSALVAAGAVPRLVAARLGTYVGHRRREVRGRRDHGELPGLPVRRPGAAGRRRCGGEPRRGRAHARIPARSVLALQDHPGFRRIASAARRSADTDDDARWFCGSGADPCRRVCAQTRRSPISLAPWASIGTSVARTIRQWLDFESDRDPAAQALLAVFFSLRFFGRCASRHCRSTAARAYFYPRRSGWAYASFRPRPAKPTSVTPASSAARTAIAVGAESAASIRMPAAAVSWTISELARLVTSAIPCSPGTPAVAMAPTSLSRAWWRPTSSRAWASKGPLYSSPPRYGARADAPFLRIGLILAPA